MKKVLVTGGNGNLGRTLCELLIARGHEVLSTDVDTLDITSPESISKSLASFKPDALVNCAAYTNVDQAETDKDINMKINGTAVGLLAKATHEAGVQFIHVSTDYVFGDNSTEGYSEDADPGDRQVNEYGRAKRFGEVEAMKNNPESYIVRTSWIFGPYNKNFVDTMLKLAETKTELSIVSDEIGKPTSTADLAQALLLLIEQQVEYKPGYYHAASEGSCSRYEQAEFIFQAAGISMKLTPIKLADYPRAAKIPNYSLLINNKLPKLPDWKQAITNYLNLKKAQ